MAIELPIKGDQSIIKQFGEVLEQTSLGPVVDGVKAGNFNGHWIEFTSNAVADTEDGITHKLGRVPTGFLVAQKNKASTLYNGSSNWTKTKIYLRSNVATTIFRILVW